jgi:hypothetical protein
MLFLFCHTGEDILEHLPAACYLEPELRLQSGLRFLRPRKAKFFGLSFFVCCHLRCVAPVFLLSLSLPNHHRILAGNRRWIVDATRTRPESLSPIGAAEFAMTHEYFGR